MGWALAGTLGAVATGGASVSPAFGQATTAGNDLFAWITSNSGSATNPFSTSATGWTILPFGGAFAWFAVGYRPNCGASETAPVFTTGGSTGNSISQLGEFSGGQTASPLDQSGNGSGTTIQTAQAAAGDAAAGDLIIGGAYWNAPGGVQTASNTLTDSAGNAVTVHASSGQPGGSGQVVYDFVWGVAGATTGGAGDKLVATLSAFAGGGSGIASFKAVTGAHSDTAALTLSDTRSNTQVHGHNPAAALTVAPGRANVAAYGKNPKLVLALSLAAVPSGGSRRKGVPDRHRWWKP